MRNAVNNKLKYALMKVRAIPFEKRKCRVYAVLCNKRGQLITEGANDYTKTHPKQKAYSIKSGLSDERQYIHAEIKAIIRAKRIPPRSVLIVCRVDSKGFMLDAFPCISCLCAIISTGNIIKIVYSTPYGFSISDRNQFKRPKSADSAV